MSGACWLVALGSEPVRMTPRGIGGRITSRTGGAASISPMPSQAGENFIPCEHVPTLCQALGIWRGLRLSPGSQGAQSPLEKQSSYRVQLRRVLSLSSSVAWGPLNLSRPQFPYKMGE